MQEFRGNRISPGFFFFCGGAYRLTEGLSTYDELRQGGAGSPEFIMI